MPTVNPTLPNDGEGADAGDVSTPLTAILAVINGNLDGDNIADNVITSAKIVDSGITTAKINAGAVTMPKTNNPYKFSAWLNAAFNIDSTPRVIPFDTEEFDVNNNFDIVTNKGRFTAPIDGYYKFEGAVLVNAGAGYHYVLRIHKNGSDFKHLVEATTASATNTLFQASSPPVHLVAGDYIELNMEASAVSNLVVGESQVWFSGHLASV